MLNFLKKAINKDKSSAYTKPKTNEALLNTVHKSNLEASVNIYELCHASTDVMVRKFTVEDVEITLVMCEAMFSTQFLNDNLIKPLLELELTEKNPKNLYDWINNHTIIAGDQKCFLSYDELFHFIMSGFVVILIDGIEGGIACGLQGYVYRSVSEPSGETNIRGSREGFVETIRVNVSMLRRRLKSPDLKTKMMSVGKKSKTDICLIYRTDCVNKNLLSDIEHRLETLPLDNVLEGGYIQPFLESSPLSIFSGIGTTERPDTLIAKISEGRVGILVDGTPYALVLPYLFNEHFQTFDDYTLRPYFVSLMRIIKYIAFFTSILLPGFYVAIASFHPELFPTDLLYDLALAESSTPLPLVLEAFLIHLFYEILREAGLRLPKPIGHAVSIVGGLVIGDAAVSAGLVGAPLIVIVALTAITAFVVPTLYEPVMIMRFSFIFLAGFLGLFGVSLGLCIALLNLCAINSYGIPSSSPFSPFNFYSMRDLFIRVGWKSLTDEDLRVSDIPGSEMRDNND